jgi:LacI family transcriptional regulator
MIIPEAVTSLFVDPFFPLLLRGATEACNKHHYQLILSLFDDPAKQEEMYQRVLRNGYLDGVIVASASLSDPLIPHLLFDQIPFVSVGKYDDERVHYVDTENAAGTQMAVEHLIRLGHRRIGTITGPMDMIAGQERLGGYRQALEAHRIPMDEDLIVEGDFSEGSGALGMQKLLSASPSAVFAASDMMAIGALKTLRQAGLQVPQDVAVVGFDDIPLASALEPTLTTVRQPIERLGAMSVEVLLGRLQEEPDECSATHKIILPAELIVRESCGALK